ncbi:MAG: hypothetical protein HZA54_12170 [Planctomycetes bacterium]|nr:hypothetical protein [Planctomycetota bacterium]
MHVRYCSTTAAVARLEVLTSVGFRTRTRTRTRRPWAFEYEYEYDRGAVAPPRCTGCGGPVRCVAGAALEGTSASALPDMHPGGANFSRRARKRGRIAAPRSPNRSGRSPMPEPAPAATPAARRREAALAVHFCLFAAAWLFLHWNVQAAISQDHGRDLLCYARTAHGETPYLDFQWIYGPLAPYVYGAAFRVAGASVAAARDLYLVFVLLGALATAWAARRLLPPGGAHAAGVLVLFWGGAPHSYNQVLLLPLFALGADALLAALDAPRPPARRLAAIYGIGLLAGLIKGNVGIAWIAAATLVLLVGAQVRAAGGTAPRTQVAGGSAGLLLGAGGALAGLAAVYLPLYFAMPEAHRRLCFGIGARYGFQGSILESVFAWPRVLVECLASALGAPLPSSGPWTQIGAFDLLDRGLAVPFLGVCGFAVGAAALLLHARRGRPWAGAVMARLGLWTTAVLLAHELPIHGSPYALLDAALPPLLLLALDLGRQGAAALGARVAGPRAGRVLLLGWLVVAPAWLTAAHLRGAEVAVVPLHLARGGGIRVYSDPQREELEATVLAVRRLTGAGEAVAVLPYDPLYAFLADRANPLYAMPVEAFDFSPADEAEMIAALERGPVRCVLVTNFALSLHPADGVFGVTHLPVLARHVAERYLPVFRSGFGPWRGFPFHPEGAQVLVMWRRGSELPPEFPR